MALKSDGTLWAWGFNYFGQLGDGTTTDKYNPFQIGSDNKWVSVVAEDYHTVALKSDGTLWAWGRNWYSQIGDGSKTDRHSPVQIYFSYILTINKVGTGSGSVNATGCTFIWNGNTGTCTADYGTDISLSGSANEGSTFAGWSSGSGSASSCSGTGNCTFNITTNSGVIATFTINQYTVSANAGAGGSISPAFSVVNHGSTTTFTVTPDTGYSIESVTGCNGSLSGNIYTTGSITADCNI